MRWRCGPGKFAVRLTQEERDQLEHTVRAGRSPVRVATRARILLKTDEGWSASRVAQALDVAEGTVFRIKRRFAEDGLDGALNDRAQTNRYRKLDDRGEAHLIALACSPAPEGHDHWNLRLLETTMAEVTPASEKNSSNPGRRVSHLRAIRSLLRWSTQMLADARPAIPVEPGRPRRVRIPEGGHPEPVSEPPLEACGGNREAHRGGLRPADAVAGGRGLPRCTGGLGSDNRTHRKASLYQAFPAAEARRIAKRLEFHFTPKHGSWLNMAEIEFSVLSRSCLRKRLPDEAALCREVHALELERNEAQARINWRFSIQDARTKLHRLYPFNS